MFGGDIHQVPVVDKAGIPQVLAIYQLLIGRVATGKFRMKIMSAMSLASWMGD
jgi:hypothetical protein